MLLLEFSLRRGGTIEASTEGISQASGLRCEERGILWSARVGCCGQELSPYEC